MKKYFSAFLILTLFFCNAFGQSNEIKNLVEQGVKLHDSGDFNGAIEQYKKALQIDNNSALANYEIASTYFHLKLYDKAIFHCNVILSAKADLMAPAYMVKANSLDLLGKPKEALKIYKKAIKKFPNDYLLYFNFALTSMNQKKYKDAENALQRALIINPTHASSHLILGFLMYEQGFRVKSILALYNFLLLEPRGNRAKAAYKLFDSQLKKGVKRNGANQTTITLSKANQTDEFRTAEVMISMLEASKSLEDNQNKTEAELFAENTKTLFSVLGELNTNKDGFWWDFYVDFYYALTKENHSEALSYYVSQLNEDETIIKWLKDNNDKLDAMAKWLSSYQRKL